MKTRTLIRSLLLAFSFQPLALLAQTPVLFTMQGLTGRPNNEQILIQPDREENMVTFGTNLVPMDDFVIQPSGGQVITNLIPWGYTITVAGWTRGVHIVVPSSTNTLNVVTLINTNQFAPLNLSVGTVLGSPGTNIALVTNADSSVTISDPYALTASSTVAMSQVTGPLPAAQLPAIVVTNLYPTIYPNYLEWWDGQDLQSANGQTITSWQGKRGHTLYGSAVAQYPGVAFNGTYSTIMTNLSFPGDACYNAATIFFLFRAPANNFNNGQGLSFCQPSMAHPSFGLNLFVPVAHYPTMDWLALNPTNGTSWSTFYSCDPQVGESLSGQNVHLFSMTLLAGGYCDIFVDGKMTANTLMSDISLVPTWPAIQGGTSLGYDWLWAGTPAFQGSVYGLLIYTNTFSLAQMDAENTALMQRAGISQQVSINLDGDSVIFGGLANTLSTPIQLLQSNYPNYRITCTAYPGRTSANVLLNQTNWITTVSDPSTKIDICWMNLQNDSTTVWQVVATNMTLWCSNDLALGRRPVPLNPWSNMTTDNNGVRTNFNNWLTTNWWNIAPAMIDLSRDQLLGYVGAYANAALIPDGMHGTNASYQRIISGYFVPTINHLLNGSFICTSTSCVPPTVTQPWTATDPNAPGVQFVNNAGVWAPVQPANSVLNQLGSLDDYMSIDQQNPYDVTTALLPQINGNYYGVGKLAPAAGNWVFYFNPSRWPLFEWSGFTNQVLWVHLFATNAATVNWIASVRYFTNGLSSGPGAGSGGTTFGTGIFQCGAGTNDYWLAVTNHFTPQVMTNTTAACFFWGVNNPSTNVWVIEGTHLHAQ